MSRLIDADAFVRFLKDTIKKQAYENLKIDELLTVADVIEAIISELDGTSLDGFKNAPTIEPEPKWIPCSERLPETMYCRCLVSIKIRTDGIGEATYKYGRWFAVEYLEDGRVRKYDISDSVTAWMPLPSPYRGERRTDDNNKCDPDCRSNDYCSNDLEHTSHIRLSHRLEKHCISVITDCGCVE